jgi:Flp pilus assembly protein TadD
MAKQQQTCSGQEIVRDHRRQWAAPRTMKPALMTVMLTLLAAAVVAFAVPQAGILTSPSAPQATSPAPQTTSPAPGAQPDQPATPSAVTQAVAAVIAKARVGDAQMAAKEYDAAIVTYLSLIPQVSDRGKGDLWAHVGEAYRFKGDYVNSIDAFEKAFALIPDDARVSSNLGVLYDAQNDKVHARQFYEKAIAINPGNPLILNNLAFLLAESGVDLDLALTYARTAQAKAPTSTEIDDTIGWIDLKKNMIPGAVAEFRKITQTAPNSPVYHYHYAMALKQQGNLADAAKECQAALNHKPDKQLEIKINLDCIGTLPETK